MPKYYFNKTFIEARYKNSLFFNEMKYLQNIINVLESKFPISEYNNNNKVLVLANTDTHLNVNVFENRFVIDMDEPGSLEEFKKSADEIMEIIIKELGISRFNRIGMRIIKGIDKHNINEANTFVKKNFMKITDDAYKILGEDIQSYGVSFLFKSKEYNVNLNIKPNKFQLVEVKDNTIVRKDERDQVLIDVDIFKEIMLESSSIIAESFINDVIEINNENIDKFISKVSVY